MKNNPRGRTTPLETYGYVLQKFRVSLLEGPTGKVRFVEKLQREDNQFVYVTTLFFLFVLVSYTVLLFLFFSF